MKLQDEDTDMGACSVAPIEQPYLGPVELPGFSQVAVRASSLSEVCSHFGTGVVKDPSILEMFPPQDINHQQSVYPFLEDVSEYFNG
jgi:hypothetical protein